MNIYIVLDAEMGRMTGEECLRRAAAAHSAMLDANKRYALYVTAFGGTSELARSEKTHIDRAAAAERKWKWMATLNTSTREKFLRDGSLPSWMFGYGM